MPNIKDAAAMTPQSRWETTVDEAVTSRSAAANANRLAAEKIIATRQQYGETHPVEVVPFRLNGTDEIQFSVIRQAAEIENLVLRGGTKAAGYPPTLVELEKDGMTNDVKQVVATSAGALAAALLAAGLSAEQSQKISDAHDMASFKDKPPNWDTKYPQLKFGMMGFQAGAAMELVDRESAKSVQSFLDSDDGQAKMAAAVAERRIDADDADALEGLRHQNFEIDRTIQMVTFRDLESLSKVAPEKFKALTLTGWNDTDETLAHFNAKDTPHVPIAVAGRISMSIPYFFTSPTCDGGEAEMSWVDGGVGSNMPAGAIFDDLEQALKHLGAQMRTMEAIVQRQNQATCEIFTDPASGASSLSPDERTAFLHAGPPNPQMFANSDGVVDDRLHQAAVQFYEEAARLSISS